ncbi:hypothetical protein [Atopobium deltae]|uniref:RNA polymerase sigma-70 region 4 domain-containing protein n=1 Tax=Atopobium deltae TaxID=1393034 RepID=A0A133XSQ6_9ACTN|nr:hypothetical protein [Atopobium deltae]KXB33982.1 hypothetical protein HMPREF3192_00975 [Atopobium deltae]
MDETDEPTQGMLNFTRALLAQRMGNKRAKDLPDDEIAWIAPLVQHELDKLMAIARDIVILRYGLYGSEPLSYEKVGIQVGKEKTLTRERARQITAHTIRTLSHAIFYMNPDEYNLYALLSGKKGATPVLNLNDTLPTSGDLEHVINDLKIIQYKYNVCQFIFEEYKKSLDEQIPD